MKHVKGFTLIEAIFTVAILVIIGTLSSHSLGIFLAKNKVASDLLMIQSMVALARSEAITKGTPIKLCNFEQATTNSQNPSRCSRHWETLNILNQNNKVLAQKKLTNSYKKVVWSSFQRKQYLSFTSLGYTAHQNGTLYLCHKKYPELNRAVVINKAARVRVEKNNARLQKKCH